MGLSLVKENKWRNYDDVTIVEKCGDNHDFDLVGSDVIITHGANINYSVSNLDALSHRKVWHI
jgi:hypothetical protein